MITSNSLEDVPAAAAEAGRRGVRLTDPLSAGDEPHVLILGADARALAIGDRLQASKMRVIGHLGRDDDQSRNEVVGTYSELEQILRDEVVDRVVVAVHHDSARQIVTRALHLCALMGVPVCAEEAYEQFLRCGRLSAGAKMVPLGSTMTPSDSALVVRRFVDRLLALLMIVVGLPVFPLLAIAIRLDSKGPIIFRQVRVRNNGRHFHLFKFRTMVDNAEELKARLMAQNQVDGPAFKIEGDPRITRVGHLLRRLRMDELPQLFNILSGDMAIVGPRPPLPAEVERYESWYMRRLSVTPGLTCLWQIEHGPLGVGFTEWMRLDCRYIEEWSLWNDAKIFLRTVPIVLFGIRAM